MPLMHPIKVQKQTLPPEAGGVDEVSRNQNLLVTVVQSACVCTGQFSSYFVSSCLPNDSCLQRQQVIKYAEALIIQFVRKQTHMTVCRCLFSIELGLQLSRDGRGSVSKKVFAENLMLICSTGLSPQVCTLPSPPPFALFLLRI